jgi:hypothetical protein
LIPSGIQRARSRKGSSLVSKGVRGAFNVGSGQFLYDFVTIMASGIVHMDREGKHHILFNNRRFSFIDSGGTVEMK